MHVYLLHTLRDKHMCALHLHTIYYAMYIDDAFTVFFSLLFGHELGIYY